MPIYKDNANNRRLKRVGMGYGKECSPCEPKSKSASKPAPAPKPVKKASPPKPVKKPKKAFKTPKKKATPEKKTEEDPTDYVKAKENFNKTLNGFQKEILETPRQFEKDGKTFKNAKEYAQYLYAEALKSPLINSTGTRMDRLNFVNLFTATRLPNIVEKELKKKNKPVKKPKKAFKTPKKGEIFSDNIKTPIKNKFETNK